jgi:hypothetical protein
MKVEKVVCMMMVEVVVVYTMVVEMVAYISLEAAMEEWISQMEG